VILVADCSPGGGCQAHADLDRRVYEIVLSWQVDITTELLCIIELTAAWLSSYYEISA